MAGWWMPWRQLEALRRIDAGEAVLTDGGRYWWLGGGGCTPQAKALLNRGLIARSCGYGPFDHMRITPTGRNELGYHSGLTEEHYKK